LTRSRTPWSPSAERRSELARSGARRRASRWRRRAVLDALNPWVDLEAVYELERRAPSDIDDALIDEALNAIANNFEEVSDQAFKTRRQLKRELAR